MFPSGFKAARNLSSLAAVAAVFAVAQSVFAAGCFDLAQ